MFSPSADHEVGKGLADLEKVVNHPQGENSELNNVLKIARFVTKDDQKYVYIMSFIWSKIYKIYIHCEF